MNETILEEPRYFFWLVTGEPIRSIKQLIEMVPVLTEEQFRHHVDGDRNDFYSWVKGVFDDNETADLIKSCTTKNDFEEKLYNYLLAQKQKQEERLRGTFDAAQKKAFVQNPERFAKFHERESRREEKVADEFDAATRRINEKRQHSILPETITRLEAMQERLRELREYITETRKGGRDPFMAELVLKRFKPKIEYAQVTQQDGDFDQVELVLNKAERELEDAVMAPLVDAQKEIDLLLSITKDSKPKRVSA